MDFVQQMTASYTPGAPGFIALVISSVPSFYLGFIEYVWSIRLVVKEHRSPFPLWVHCFYFAHDTTAFVLWVKNAIATNGFWLWSVGAPLFLAWAIIEVVNMYYAYKYERNEVLGSIVHGEVTLKHFMSYVIFYVALFYMVVNVIRSFTGDNSMWTWSTLTQIVMACAHSNLWRRRGERRGTSVKLAIYMVCSMALTYAPFGMYSLALPGVFDKPWCYAAGIICTGIAIINLIYVIKLPKKEQLPGEKKPIW